MASRTKSSILKHLFFFSSFLHLHSLAYDNSSATKGSRCRVDELSALVEFRDSLSLANVSSDPLAYPKTKSWKVDTDCCIWDGVKCNEEGLVIALDLSSSFLYGSINFTSSLFRLVQLEWLNLADDNFNYSTIPVGFGHMERLAYLNLSSSRFVGQVPSDILSLARLVSLDLSNNLDADYSGLLELRNPGLGSLIQNLTSLHELNLGDVRMSSTVPVTLVNSSSLRRLNLTNCRLFGEFPPQIFHLPNLQYLSLADNSDLTAYLPDFSMRSPLEWLELGNTNFSGELPISIGNLTRMNHLDLLKCRFSGSIPLSLGQLKELNHLEIGWNRFSPQPLSSLSWLWNMTKLATLGLGGINLRGDIPPSVGHLSRLVRLFVGENQLTGVIPPAIRNLTKLDAISFRLNELSGSIPSWLMNMTNLKTLGLSDNRIKGEIPPTISQLWNLEAFDVRSNDLTGAVDLDIFLKLKKLLFWSISGNKLLATTGNETQIDDNPQLIVLGLGGCNLGAFPGFLQHQEKLRLIDLSNNNIQGEVPAWIWNLSPNTLEYMDLSFNMLSGQYHIPTILPHKHLDVLQLSANRFKGPLPEPPTSIREYMAAQNELEGEFPRFICNLSSLVQLDLSSNNITGMLPGCLWNFSRSLSTLNLKSNRLHGRIPEFSDSGIQLRMIDLSQNQVEGKLPRSLANCVMLEFMNLANNRINDTFPHWLGSLPELKVLIIRSNRFHGTIGTPMDGSAFGKMRIFDLSQNSFHGNISKDYFQSWNAMKMVPSPANDFRYLQNSIHRNGSSSTPYFFQSSYPYTMTVIYKGLNLYYPEISDILTIMDLSSNAFEGKIPDAVGDLKGLQGLNLSGNSFTGQIPPSLGNLTALESLDLSRNQLSGQIPQTLTEITSLSFLNLSNNNLTGPIPRGKQFDTFSSESYEGNHGLCGDMISRKCDDAGESPPQHLDKGDTGISDELPWMMIIIMGYGSGLVVGVVLGNVFASWKHAWFVPNDRQIRRRLKGRARRARN